MILTFNCQLTSRTSVLLWDVNTHSFMDWRGHVFHSLWIVLYTVIVWGMKWSIVFTSSVKWLKPSQPGSCFALKRVEKWAACLKLPLLQNLHGGWLRARKVGLCSLFYCDQSKWCLHNGGGLIVLPLTHFRPKLKSHHTVGGKERKGSLIKEAPVCF